MTELEAEVYVTAAGVRDDATAGSLRDCLDELAGRTDGRRTVVLDVGDCRAIDAASVSLLVETHRRFAGRGRSLVVANATGAVRDALLTAGVDGHLELAE